MKRIFEFGVFKLVVLFANFETDNLDQGCRIGVGYVLVDYRIWLRKY